MFERQVHLAQSDSFLSGATLLWLGAIAIVGVLAWWMGRRTSSGSTSTSVLSKSSHRLPESTTLPATSAESHPSPETPLASSLTENAILEAVASLVVVLDRQGRILRFNAACVQTTGMSQGEVLGKPFWEVVIPVAEREKIMGEFGRLVATGTPRPLENEWLTKDGTSRLIVWSNAVVRGPKSGGGEAGEGPVQFVIGTGTDVSEGRKLQQELIHAQRMEVVGQLAGGIAHDFNNLLTAIFGHTSLAKKLLPPTHPAAVSLERVEQAATQAVRVIRSLLTFSRRESTVREVVSVVSLLEETQSLLLGSLPHTYRLQCQMPPESLCIRVDRLQMQQAILNLAFNARDAMPTGGSLRLFTTQDPAAPGRIRICVADAGEGLSREVLARVFEPFFTTKPKGSGSGLGLPIVRSIVGEHGGSVSIESQRARGTTVTIELPLCESLPVSAKQPIQVSTSRIIVAVSRPYPRQVIATTLRDMVVDVLEVRDATTLASSLAGQGPSLGAIVVEASLAQGAAYHALLAAAQSGVPIVVLCSPEQHPGQLSALATVLQEPYTMAQLAEQVRKGLELRSSIDAPPAGTAHPLPIVVP